MARTANVFARVETEIKEQAAPLSYGSLTREQFDAEMEKGMADVKTGRVYSADTIDAEMTLDKADRLAAENAERMSHEEVFGNLRRENAD